MLTVQHICKAFGSRKVFRDVSLELGRGEVLCLLGPSGCGKTTLLRIIAGFELVDSGSVAICDRIVSGPGVCVSPNQRGVGMVFQDLGLWPHMTALANVAFMLSPISGGRKSRKAKALQLLNQVGLAEMAGQYPHSLSGGEQQRLALARALAPEPELLLMDEPFSSLDWPLRREMLSLVRDIHVERGGTILFVTHDPHEPALLATLVGRIAEGRILDIGPVSRFMADRDTTSRSV